jgi:class 3 adenylate cyclase
VSDQPINQRLTAILIADVAGYTKLMEADEAGTYAAWRGVRGIRAASSSSRAMVF